LRNQAIFGSTAEGGSRIKTVAIRK